MSIIFAQLQDLQSSETGFLGEVLGLKSLPHVSQKPGFWEKLCNSTAILLAPPASRLCQSETGFLGEVVQFSSYFV